MFKKVIRYASNPYYALGYDLIKTNPHLMSDKFFLSVLWKMLMGYELDWKHPQTLNEKLQWLKLYDRNPLYTKLVDKYLVKQWVAEKIGEQYIIPTLAVYRSVDEIDLDKLPDQFVLKCNHDSGSVVICRDKGTFDIESAKEKLSVALKRNFYWEAREWPYKNVDRLVFAEKYIQEGPEGNLTDYKFFCFNGIPDCVMVCIDRHINQPKFYFFNQSWDLQRYNIRGREAPSDFSLPKPPIIDELFRLASILSDNIPFVRADFYGVSESAYFGELTFFPEGGFDRNILPTADYFWGQKILL